MAFTLHLYASFLALALGGLVLFMRKGSWLHRTLGSIWVSSMMLSALSSFWLGSSLLPLVGHFGPVHLLSAWVLVSVTMGLVSILGRQARQHRQWMVGAYLGLVGAFVGTLMPGRWVSAQLGLW
ncbi:DUF2306 domain-containing protein [Halomonas sabkhae]|uniref:DUF2306 domain-containing protein n=1 Tax=Halomonas sabkhae TaxID=626223 RepID=UPI0025B5C8A8|nr:DUF2306 domain-containing protein [Halomonas sabkhae]MDN3525950.1 DUF2306 domain-containing protein [Halomonas sabkhae]